MQNLRQYLQPRTLLSRPVLSGLLILLCILTLAGLLHYRSSGRTRVESADFTSRTTPSPSLQSALVSTLAPTPTSTLTSAPDAAPRTAVEAQPSPTAVPTLGKSAAPAPVSSTAGATTEDYVNMRTGPGGSYPIVAQLPADMRAKILGTQNGWYHILTPWDTKGWVTGDYFQPVAAPSGPQPTVLGSAAAVGVVNLRSGLGTGYSSLGTLADGTVLEVLELHSDWYKVRSPGGTTGWVSTEYVPLDWIPDIYGGSSPPAAAASSDVVRIAQKYLGARYVWGGSYPDGFDCSGLTWYVYQKVGVSLPGGSAQQFSRQYGRYIGDMSALAPGDLVFFERTTEETGITHIGIYAGDGKMIAARSERLGVRYVSLKEPFWSSRFVGGIRPYR